MVHLLETIKMIRMFTNLDLNRMYVYRCLFFLKLFFRTLTFKTTFTHLLMRPTDFRFRTYYFVRINYVLLYLLLFITIMISRRSPASGHYYTNDSRSKMVFVYAHVYPYVHTVCTVLSNQVIFY